MEQNRICPQQAFLEKIQLKCKLQTILATAISESQQTQQFYTLKISELYDEISSKDNKITNLEEQLKFMNKKCFNLSQELTHKQRLIDRLQKTIESHEKKLKTSLHNYIEQFDFKINCLTRKDTIKWGGAHKHKKNNISEHYKKTNEIQRDKYDISNESSTFSTLHPFPNGQFYVPRNSKSPQMLGKVKSLREKNFYRHASNLLPNQYGDESPKRSPNARKKLRNERIKDLLKSPKTDKWKTGSNFLEIHHSPKFLFH